jgi:hypothetical protein
MPAHLRSIEPPTCMNRRCSKPSTVELRNTFNAVIGEYCRKHGNEALKDFEERYERHEAKLK